MSGHIPHPYKIALECARNKLKEANDRLATLVKERAEAELERQRAMNVIQALASILGEDELEDEKPLPTRKL
jgi:hypothetical protein